MGNVADAAQQAELTSTFIYDIESTPGSSQFVAAFEIETSGNVKIRNSTGHDVQRAGSGTGNARCISVAANGNHAGVEVENLVCTDAAITGSSSGTAADYVIGANAVRSYLMSSDDTADGTGSIIDQVSSDIYVSSVRGSEDLHLKAYSPAKDVGNDVSGDTNYGSEDIDGQVFPMGLGWDMGGDEAQFDRKRTAVVVIE